MARSSGATTAKSQTAAAAVVEAAKRNLPPLLSRIFPRRPAPVLLEKSRQSPAGSTASAPVTGSRRQPPAALFPEQASAFSPDALFSFSFLVWESESSSPSICAWSIFSRQTSFWWTWGAGSATFSLRRQRLAFLLTLRFLFSLRHRLGREEQRRKSRRARELLPTRAGDAPLEADRIRANAPINSLKSGSRCLRFWDGRGSTRFGLAFALALENRVDPTA